MMNSKLATLIVLIMAGATFSSDAQVPSYVNETELLGWYPLDGNGEDGSNNNNDLLNSGAINTIDRYSVTNSALAFNPAEQAHLSRPNYPFSESEFCTFSVWFKQNTPTGAATIVHRGDEISQERTCLLRMGLNNPEEVIAQSWLAGGGQANMEHPATGTTWYHAVFVRSGNGNIGRLYVNGELVQTTSINSWMLPGVDFYIGSAGGTDWFFNGRIDDVGVWNADLGDCEVKKLYYAYEVQNPTNYTGTVGGSAFFSVPEPLATPDGSTPSFQWQRNDGTGWANLSDAGQYSGATSTELTISNVNQSNDNFLFRCIIDYDGVCSDTTDQATLNVLTIGVDEMSTGQALTVYPNPNNGIFSLDLSSTDFSAQAQVVVYDAAGKEVHRSNVQASQLNIDLHSLPSGLYHVIVVERKRFGKAIISIMK